MCSLFEQFVTFTPQQKSFEKDRFLNYKIPQILPMNYRSRKISPKSFSTIPISQMNIKLHEYKNATPIREEE
jgi:hypothetical protein